MPSGLHPVRAVLGALLGAAALFAAYSAWNDAHFAYLRSDDPQRAYAVHHDDAFSLGKVIDQRLQTKPESPISDAEIGQARMALVDAPLSRVLLRIFGLKASMNGDARRAETALSLSNAISRRDALTQLWLIERSVRNDDMNGAVRHYHAALSVHPELSPALLPVLAKAISFPEVRSALAPYLARQAPWSADLIQAGIASGNPADLARLIIPVGDVIRGDRYEGLNAALITKLVQTGDFDMAARLAKAVVRGADPRAIAPLAVTDATTDKRLGGLAWTLVDDNGLLASANGLGGLDIDVDALARGPIASRMIPVAGGRNYLFGQTLRGSSDGAAADLRLNWQAFCLPAPSPSPEPVWQQILPQARRTQRYESTIPVPAACRGLQLVLSARGPEGQQPAHAALETLDLRPQQN